MQDRPIVNVDEVPLAEKSHGDKFFVRWGRAGPAVGLTGLGCAVHVVPPGKRAFPFHTHHVMDELFYVLSGEGEYRWGDQTHAVRPGDIIGAPAGKAAHQLINTGEQDLRYLGISTIGSVDVVEYPDSGKYAVAAGIKNADFKTATFVSIARKGDLVDYWDGEVS